MNKSDKNYNDIVNNKSSIYYVEESDKLYN